MANDFQERREDAAPLLTPEAPYPLPESVGADLPTEEALGGEDDKPVQSTRHRQQGDLILHLLGRVWRHREDICIAGDLAVYYQHPQPPVVPDAMVALGVPCRDRKAYLVWKEGKGPDWVLELLSESNPAKDRERNYTIYEQRLRVPEYFWFNPLAPAELRGFRLHGGHHYEEVPADKQGRLWSEVLGLYLGMHDGWLRIYDRQGGLVLTAEEAAGQERAARLAAEETVGQERAARLAAEAELAGLREELARRKTGH